MFQQTCVPFTIKICLLDRCTVHLYGSEVDDILRPTPSAGFGSGVLSNN